MPAAYQWHPLTDFERDPKELTDGELIWLAKVWANQRAEMAENGTLDDFEKRLRREWSIETGIIENVYTLDRGVTRTLIEKGIDAALIPHGTTDRDPVLVARIIQDHYEALEALFDFIGGSRELSTGYIKEIHAALLRNQDTYAVVDQFGHAFEKRLEKGQYKSEPNSPTRPDGTVHEYCPPDHVASEMDRLIEIHNQHVAQSLPPEVTAAWLHHRFAQIHPFADGNGRVARAVSSLVFIKAGWFPLIVKRDDWSEYIGALETADRGELRPLVQMFVEAQRNALIQASEAASDVTPMRSTDQAIDALRDHLVIRGKLYPKDWDRASETARILLGHHANQIIHQLANRMNNEFAQAGFSFALGSSATPGILELIGVHADLSAFNMASALELRGERVSTIQILFYGLGPHYRGLIGVSAAFQNEGGELVVLNDSSFQINYEEPAENAQARFKPWLEQAIVAGLNEWRKTL